MIDGGFDFAVRGNKVDFIFKLFDNSTTGSVTNAEGEIIADVPIYKRLAKNTFRFDFEIDLFEKNNIFLSFNSLLGICRLYLNSVEIFSFEVNAFQMFTKKILFGDIVVTSADEETGMETVGVPEKDSLGNLRLRSEERFTGTDNKSSDGIEILLNEATNQKFISNLYLATEPLKQDEELAVIFSTNMEEIQDLYISLPCGMRNMTDTIDTVNSINTNLKNKSNVVDINVKNLNIQDKNITEEVANMLLSNITQSIPETADINNINFLDYKK